MAQVKFKIISKVNNYLMKYVQLKKIRYAKKLQNHNQNI